MMKRSILRQSRLLQFHTQLSPPSSRIHLSQTLLPRSRPSPLRYFSSSHFSFAPAAEASTQSSEGNASPPPPVSDLPQDGDKALRTELEQKNKEIVDLKDKYLRSVADFRNLQDRASRDQAQARDFAISRFARDLLESIDNLDRALTTVSPEVLNAETSSSNQDLKNLYNGLKMTDTVLMQTLKKHGLERFDPVEVEGEKFNPNLHEATFRTPMEGKEDGTIVMTQQKGFSLNGRVIRAAKVGVVKN